MAASKTLPMGQRKKIALVAHDNKKTDILDFMLSSPLMSDEYERQLPDYEEYRQWRIGGVE